MAAATGFLVRVRTRRRAGFLTAIGADAGLERRMGVSLAGAEDAL